MAFKVYQPKRIEIDPLQSGQVSIDKGGNARFLREDLDLVGIGDSVVVLTDELTLRVALRKPRPSDAGRTMTVSSPKGPHGTDKTRAYIRLSGALRELRLEPEAVKGRYELTTKDDLLIVNLADCKAGPGDDEEGAA